jgi:hypothetical protein
MDNMYTYDSNGFYNGRYNAANNYNSMSNYGYCPYAAYNNALVNYTRNDCACKNNYYQYSPTVNCINPVYPGEGGNGSYNGASNNWNLRMRTVTIEDIRD